MEEDFTIDCKPQKNITIKKCVKCDCYLIKNNTHEAVSLMFNFKDKRWEVVPLEITLTSNK